ncbi:SRPBCC family protein [Halobacterium sp. CBA1126]|uniref:SRPBCC family protein n=1 Tax=Halobacterium sp. CBA1126 TaxID=2668074 RepID=UPI0012FA5D7F|nr:SRPBCC family protein [Halobacterium sp. CBA1126]MUV61129.1 SRPBCC family protein [Halobacterium sp. CBA1126]
MNEVTETRRLAVGPDAVRDAMADLEAFVMAAGFDEVTVDGDRITVANRVGVADIELELEVVEREGAALAYEQREGIFEAMWTEYVVDPRGEGGCEVTARTAFSLDVPVVGDMLDATVIERQRRKELTAQLDWLAAEA